MIDLYLRAGNAGAMASACPFLRREDEQGGRHWITNGPNFILDVIGTIELTPARFNKLGVQTYAAVVDNRFHLNLRCDEEFAALVPESVIIRPLTPRRLWA